MSLTRYRAETRSHRHIVCSVANWLIDFSIKRFLFHMIFYPLSWKIQPIIARPGFSAVAVCNGLYSTLLFCHYLRATFMRSFWGLLKISSEPFNSCERLCTVPIMSANFLMIFEHFRNFPKISKNFENSIKNLLKSSFEPFPKFFEDFQTLSKTVREF